MSFFSVRWRILLVLGIAFFEATLGVAEPNSQDGLNYRLGSGLRLGDSGFWLGGYANAFVEDYRNEPWKAELADLSLFVGWESGRWRFFSEIEFGELLAVSNGKSLSTRHAYVDVERFYMDYQFEDVFKVRGGKFLTPIGRWNLIHAAPLVWTTSTPMVVKVPFPMHQTGGLAYGNLNVLGKQLSYAVYGGGGNDVDFGDHNESNDYNFRDTVGVRLYHDLPGKLQLGFSYAHFTERFLMPGQKNLLGLDVFWAHKRYEVSGEFAYRFGGGSDGLVKDARSGNPNLWGLYLQGVAPLVDGLFAVARYEVFEGEGIDSPGHLWLAGLAYRPITPLVFKVEYSFGSNADRVNKVKAFDVQPLGFSEGFAASVAILF